MTALAGRRADFYVTAGASVAFPANDPMSDVSANFGGAPGAGARTVYAVTNAVRRYFDPATPLVIQQSLDSGGTWNTVMPDVVDAGTITFVVPRQAAPLAQLRVLSGNYLPWARVAGGYEWAATPAVQLLDATEFGMTSRKHVANQIGEGTIAVKRFWYDDSLRSLLGGRMVAVLWLNAAAQPVGPRYEGYVMLKSDSLKVSIAGLVTEDPTFEIDGDLVYLAA